MGCSWGEHLHITDVIMNEATQSAVYDKIAEISKKYYDPKVSGSEFALWLFNQLKINRSRRFPFGLKGESCPNRGNHHEPDGLDFAAWDTWAKNMEKTHIQKRCPVCNLYLIWSLKP